MEIHYIAILRQNLEYLDILLVRPSHRVLLNQNHIHYTCNQCIYATRCWVWPIQYH